MEITKDTKALGHTVTGMYLSEIFSVLLAPLKSFDILALYKFYYYYYYYLRCTLQLGNVQQHMK